MYKLKQRHSRYHTKSLGLMDEILFYINCLFTKYTEWSHEAEYRMVIIDPSATRDYYFINTSIMARYLGCENKATSILYKKPNKATNDYLLK